MTDQQPQQIFVQIPPLNLDVMNLVLAGLSEFKIKEGIDAYMMLWQCRQNAILEAQQQAAGAAATPVEAPIPDPVAVEDVAFQEVAAEAQEGPAPV